VRRGSVAASAPPSLFQAVHPPPRSRCRWRENVLGVPRDEAERVAAGVPLGESLPLAARAIEGPARLPQEARRAAGVRRPRDQVPRSSEGAPCRGSRDGREPRRGSRSGTARSIAGRRWSRGGRVPHRRGRRPPRPARPPGESPGAGVVGPAGRAAGGPMRSLRRRPGHGQLADSRREAPRSRGASGVSRHGGGPATAGPPYALSTLRLRRIRGEPPAVGRSGDLARHPRRCGARPRPSEGRRELVCV
jgi:hypothetical protein